MVSTLRNSELHICGKNSKCKYKIYNIFSIYLVIFVVIQLLSHVWLYATPWTAICQASLSFIISQSLLKLMSIELVMPFNHLVLCHPLLLLPLIFPRIRERFGFSNDLALCIRWPKYWSFGFSISPSNEFPLGLTGLISLLSRDSQESSPTPQFKNINSSALSLGTYRLEVISGHILDYWSKWQEGAFTKCLGPHGKFWMLRIMKTLCLYWDFVF